MASYQIFQDNLGVLPEWLIRNLKEGEFNDETGNVSDDLLFRVAVGCIVSKYAPAPPEVIDEVMKNKKVTRLASLATQYAKEAVDV